MAGTLGDVLVLGLGKSGDAAARYCAARLGLDVDSVTVVEGSDSDRAGERAAALEALGVRVLLGTEAVAGHYDVAIASPGIAPHAPLMRHGVSAADRVVSELEFAFERSECPWIAITGTNGKTTTTALVTHLLTAAGIPARAVGNIGHPAIQAVAEDPTNGVLVAEVSSFQLALTAAFRPRVAVLLNITPDHIDWHGSLEAYAADKAKVFRNMGAGDVAVIDVDDPGSASLASVLEPSGVSLVRVSRQQRHTGGAFLSGGDLALDTPAGVATLLSSDELLIKGPHNVSNALAAAAAAHAFGVPLSVLPKGLATFEPIEHRLEPVGIACGIEWFNDSKATNPDAVFKALESFGDRPLVLLLGGRNKGNDFAPLARAVAGRARSAVVFGEAGPEIAAALTAAGAHVEAAVALRAAVDVAARIAERGDAVVLSPACASFDEFRDYEHRGSAFREYVRDLDCGDEA